MLRSLRTLVSKNGPAGSASDTLDDATQNQHRIAGDAFRDRGEWGAAAASYRLHVEAQPDDFAIWVQLGHALKELRRFGEALEAYSAAHRLKPSESDLIVNLGHLYKLAGDLRAAARCYLLSVELDGNPDAAAELADPETALLASELSGLTAARSADPTKFSMLLSASQAADEQTPNALSGEPRFFGTIDFASGGEIRGWAIDPNQPTKPAELEFVVDGKVVAQALAHRPRPDVAAAGFGSTHPGFKMLVDTDAPPGTVLRGVVRLSRTGAELANNPIEMVVPDVSDKLAKRHPTNARSVIVKPLVFHPGEHCVFVAHAPTGMLKPFVRNYLKLLRDNGVSVALVVNADRPVLLDDAILEMVSGAIVRENLGYDFAAWAHTLFLMPALFGSKRLYMINDSVFGPKSAEAFAELINKIRSTDGSLVGLTQTLERGWHLQSYFLAVRQDFLASYTFQIFVNEVEILDQKDMIIDRYEVTLASRAHAAGFRVELIYPLDEAFNPTLFGWRKLIALGFPFVKILLLRGEFAHIDTTGIRGTLTRSGFDMAAIDEALRYGTDEPPPAPGFPLLAKPIVPGNEEAQPSKPYKVAFYGPWNFDNGLGAASRGIIGAIRQTGVRLNLHPIKMPFHVHKALVPPYDVFDFDGPPDIAIVHLNPDSWHLLTQDQQAAIAAAKKRIGYWVWEMDHLPKAWRKDFSSVDRIWAPSSYCARLFEAQDEAPVDVVPHAVPLEDVRLTPDAQQRIMNSLGLDPTARTILYVFDGSSYLVRKNPAALIRAFGDTELGKRGWRLVLKTKHLRDRPEDGDALERLAQSTHGVHLLNRSLTAGELRDLVAVADIYASPHCSEGFGLTVAEAMAMGKIVIATDFSGTRDFLDASSGFPVACKPWVLEEDFGHYAKGGSWARIDEKALAAALCEAASRVEAGDLKIGAQARARIGRDLSYHAVGKRIAASFDALLTTTEAIRRLPPRIEGIANFGLPTSAALGEHLSVLKTRPGSLEIDQRGLESVEDKTDKWLLVVPSDARLNPMIRGIVAQNAAARPDIAIFYGDDGALGEATLLDQLRFKPSFDLTLFAAQDYIGAPLIIRGSALHELGGFNPEKGAAALTDIVLRALEQGMGVDRICEVLAVQEGSRPLVPVEARQALIEASPLYAAYHVRPGKTPSTIRLEGRFSAGLPHVTLCVPTRRSVLPDGNGTFIERFLESVARVDWPEGHLTVIVGDDVRGVPEWAKRDWPFSLRRIQTIRPSSEPFNYSAKMNRLWRAADTEVIVLMNDDVMAIDDQWLRHLAGFAVDEGVGGVGARLLYDDGSVQHAGVVGGIFGTSVHVWLSRRGEAPTYQDWAITQREWSLVTGAVFATRKSVMERIGGFDEGFSLEFNDIDLCLKIRTAGLRIVYNPFAEMIHTEKASRGKESPPGDQLALFLRRWSSWLLNDPASHPGMRRDMLDFTPAIGEQAWYL